MMTREQHRAAMHALSIAHITSPSENRMRAHTAREQHAAAMDALKGPDDLPYSDDESIRQGYWPGGECPR